MTLLTAFGLAIFISLGMWQLERAAFKEAIKNRFETRMLADFRLFDSRETPGDIEYRKLILRGRYNIGRSMLLDNQLLGGRAGYHVLSPFILSASNKIVLVNRGWVAAGPSREILPSIEVPMVIDRVRGIASVPDMGGYRLGEVSLRGSWPAVVPFIDIEAMQPQFDDRLLPFVLWLSPEQAGHYQREWNPAWDDPEKSRAYALQWFSFALIAFVLFIFLNSRKQK